MELNLKSKLIARLAIYMQILRVYGRENDDITTCKSHDLY